MRNGCGTLTRSKGRLPITDIDPEVLALARAYIERVKTGRGVLALNAILERGSVTTAELNKLGYDHPPRAIADVRDNGIPIVTDSVRSTSGKRMASYRLGTAEDIRAGQVGRTNFSKQFRRALLAAYGPTDSITRATHDPRSLQIDHRVPYRVAGDAGLETNDVGAFMLLDAKSQRAKSWSCENCQNFVKLRQPTICRSCFWAFPEDYSHVAMEEVRRVDVVWQGKEVEDHDRLARLAATEGTTIQALLKKLGRIKL